MADIVVICGLISIEKSSKISDYKTQPFQKYFEFSVAILAPMIA